MTEKNIEEFQDRISTLTRLNRDLKNSFEELIKILTDLSEAISLKFDSNTVLKLISEFIQKTYPDSSVVILLYTESSGYKPAVKKLVNSDDNKKIETIISDGSIDWAVNAGKSIVLPEDLEDLECKRSFIISPLIIQETMLGCFLIFVRKTPEEFSSGDLELLNILASQSAIAIQNSLLYGSMESKNKDLAQLKNYLNNVIDHMKNGLMVCDTSGKIITFNTMASKYLLKSENEVKNYKYDEVLDLQTSEVVRKFFLKLDNGEKLGTQEIKYIRNDKFLPIKFSATCLKDDSEGDIGLIILMHDLSESVEIQRLRELDKLKNELVANVSHELRTPLTSIKAYSETLLDMVEEHDPETSKEFLQIICDESERLTNLISNLLDLSRMESGDFKLKIVEFDIVELTKKCATLLNEHAISKQVSLELAVPDFPIICNLDEGKIEQVIINLISNAIKYNRENGSVEISILEVDDNNFKFIVKDSGIGIPEMDIDKIFNKFYRVDSSLTYEISGTGLGLAIVKHIIERHNGKIFVDSRENEWSKFEIILPFSLKNE